MMSYFDHRIQEHIVESADGEYVLGREKLFTETTSDRVVKKENGDKYVDLSVHNEKPYGLDLLKEAVTKNPWLGCDYHIEPGESLKFAKVINKFIDTDDHFIFLGDFDARHHDPDFNLLKTFFGALKCRNVYLILGNNDSFPIRKYKELGIRAVTDTFEFENVVMTHFPVDVKAPKINIHGHLHGAGSPTQKGPKAYWYADPKRCVDVWRDDFTPLRLNDILTDWKKMQKYESHYDGKQRLIGESVEIDDYGIPELKKYPLDTKQHVISAIKLFGHVDKEHEQELADNIIKKIEYYNLKDEVSVGDDNRFKKYFDDYFSEEVLDELRGELFEEKDIDDELPDELVQFNKELNSWTYGVIINGKKYTSSNDVDWSKYRTIPIPIMEKEHVGICWDFVNYQHAWFKSHQIKDDSYFYVQQKSTNPDDIVTHTFSIISINGGKYWFESSWSSHKGIHKVSSWKDVVNALSDQYNKEDKFPYSLFKYNPDGLDKNVNDGDFFNKATHNLVYDYKTNYSESAEEVFEENVLISRDDIYYDFDKFESGQKNVLLITGFSGSGKSTLAEQLASKYKCDYFMIDSLEYYGERYMTLDDLKKGEPGCYEFLVKHPKIKEILDGDYSGKEFWNILCQYIPWLISWCKKRKNEKFIIEGLQLYETISRGDVPNTILKNPFIIKGTSGLRSAWRAGKRAGGKDLPAEFLKHIKWAFHDNKMIEGLKKALDEEYSESVEDVFEESYLVNEKDIYYNKERFDSGEINICFITGHSGSGKSTMGESMKSEKVEHCELDDIFCVKDAYSMDELKSRGDLIYSYFSGPGKKYYLSYKEIEERKIPGSEYEDVLYPDFVQYAMQYAKSHKNRKFVIEGVWLFCKDDSGNPYFKPSDFKDCAFYIKGTSMIISRYRAAKRDSKDANRKLLNFSKMFFKTKWKYCIMDEKTIEGFRDYFGKLIVSESTEDIITEEADYNQKNMYPVYIILTDADSPMAKMIKRYTGQPYAHALISFNEDLEPAYSFGCTSIKPLKFGFISKGEEDPFRNEEKAAYVVYAMYVTKSQYVKIQKRIQWFIDNKDKLDYAWGGLAFFGLQIPKQFKNQYFCSQFVMQIIGEVVPLSKDPSLWSPGDIEYLTNISLVDKGDDLRKFDKKRFKKNLNYLKHHQFNRLKMALESTEDDYFMEAEETLNPTTSHFLLQKIGKRVDTVLADPKNVRTFVNLVQNFINRNITKLTKSGPCDMIPFTDTDHEAFHKLFGFWYTIDPRANKTSPNEIRDIIDEYSKRAHIKCDFWKNNSSLMLFYFVIRYFTMKNDSKNLNTALAIYTLCNYPVMFHKYFPNGVMEPYMQYTIDNMTEKFIIKKSKHLFDALMTSIQASYKFHKGNFASATDKKVGDWINRIRNDQNSMMKKISNEYMKNYKAGNAARTSNEEYDGDTPIVDELENGTTVVQNLVQRVTLPIIEDGVDLVRAEAAAKMSQVSVSDCRYFLTLIITDSNADTIQKFIESLLFLYIYEGKKTERDIRSQYFLAWSASLFKKTNSKNKNINTINEILNFWAESTGLYKKFAGKTSRINYKKAIFFYLVLCIQKNV